VAATVLEQTKQELVAVPPHAREPALLARLVVALPPSKIPAIRRLLFDTVRKLGTKYRSSDGVGKDLQRDCERWAVTVAFTPVSRVKGLRSGR
jgi:hypothetical protein